MKNDKKIIAVIFCSIFSVILVSVLGAVIYYAIKYPFNYKKEILQYSKIYDVPADVVASLINAESRYNEQALSNKGAMGLMQIMPRTAEFIASELEIEDFDLSMLYDVDTNIMFGCYYLNYLYNKFEDTKVVLASYNAGEGKVQEWLRNSQYSDDGVTLKKIPYEQTSNYVDKILNGIDVYKNKLK